MRVIHGLVIVALAGPVWAQSTTTTPATPTTTTTYGSTVITGPGDLEGPNVPNGPFLAVAFHNCQPVPGADFTRTLSFIVAPTVAAGKGFLAVTACQYHADDPLPALPPGRYEVAGSQCPPTLAAVATRNQITLVPYAGGGDGGCDQAGALIPTTTTTLLGMRAAKPSRHQEPGRQFRGTCVLAKGKKPRCTFTGDVPDDVKHWDKH